ncbi:hypothetical protein PAXINDRAFT_116270 [Paxillus involutus ATCC 200175]|uniref:Uncharacterized protein n=1 Tax=Paxillus involutus ATCC 200175 TaxID=664439 RepID=A0A0C9SX54_PAXIN|nr:hypothetical protein PAXINDRAFT_116270 [Paxillus involutus ATCC 200175]
MPHPSSPDALLVQLNNLKKESAEFRAQDEETLEDLSQNGYRDMYNLLRRGCDLVRAVDAQDAPIQRIVIDAVEGLVGEVLQFATHSDPDEGLCLTGLRSFAHKSSSQSNDARIDPDFASDCEDERASDETDLVNEKRLPKGVFSHGFLAEARPLLSAMRPLGRSNIPPPSLRLPDPYDSSQKPHHSSTPLARFRNVSNLTATNSTPTAKLLYQARCEVTCRRTSSPVTLRLNQGGSCLAHLSMGGYKNRDPILTYYLLDQSMGDGDFPERRGLELPFTGGATHCAIDEERKLIFAADDSRIKSFAWGDYSDRSEAGTTFKKALPVHTLNSCDKPLKASGPIALLHDRVLRAGEGVIGVWNIDDLDQHVPGSKETIGARFDVSNTWREHGSVIEPSSGNKCHTSVTLEDGRFPIGTWHIHPSASGIMLAGFDQGYDGCYAIGLCHALDLESGKVAAKYIGHGAEVGGFSTSATEPNTFMTCCQDGYIRLFDTRQPLPVLTINESRYQSDNVSSALFIHPDGVPTIVTGARRGEEIKVWDVRARAVAYSMATGNNAVVTLAWDSTRNALYATTECTYTDRTGNPHSYRRAKIPEPQTESKPVVPASSEEAGGASIVVEDANMDDEDDAIEEESQDDYNGNGHRWPKRAEHAEDYFGHTFDAGENRIYRYAFKNEVDPDVLPGWGSSGFSWASPFY